MGSPGTEREWVMDLQFNVTVDGRRGLYLRDASETTTGEREFTVSATPVFPSLEVVGPGRGARGWIADREGVGIEDAREPHVGQQKRAAEHGSSARPGMRE